MSHEHSRGSAESRIGTNVGEYVLGSIVGSGGVGVVYSAEAADGTRVALKLVKPEKAVDETFKRRFQREARIGQTVRHPRVVPVLDSGEHNGLPYMAQQFIEGGSLAEKLERDGRLDLATTVAICAQVADGLEALSAAGMVHRDVKPANILLDREGDAYITDFGFAKDAEGTVLTFPGQALGSLDYMSPEQIRGDDVSAATDVYALGCVIFECLQGRPPFADSKGVQVLLAHMQKEPPELSDVPPAVAESVLAALRKEPAERPQRATDYVGAMSRAGGLPVAGGSHE